jgi:hypothetical protein
MKTKTIRRKEVVWYVDTSTSEGEREAKELKARLYESGKYKYVDIYHNGMYEVRVVASNQEH